MAETRVDLKHLLEDIRDSYPCTAEEAILTELVANGLDSGCSAIDIKIESGQRRLTFVDNGEGMNQGTFEQYHDIASTSKARGKGIGFAGVGAKLALLVCGEVLTETRRKGTCNCSRWWLENSFHAPWELVGALGIVPSETGTGVRLHFHRDADAPGLLSIDDVKRAIRTHFYPLLDAEFAEVLKHIYPQGVKITVNDDPVILPEMKREARTHFFVRTGKRKKLLGIGFLLRTAEELDEDQRGLAVSTYGKVIKRGWDWLGIVPKNANRLTGVVEVPELVECLTTNKSDFMHDSNSLQKYYKFRKAIQDSLSDVLKELGETPEAEAKADRGMEKLQKEIDKVVGNILPEFPELAPLFGRKSRGAPEQGLQPDADGTVNATVAEGTDAATGDLGGRDEGEGVEGVLDGDLEGNHLEKSTEPGAPARELATRRKRPGLMIGFDDETGGEAIAWLRGSTLYINALNPAYKRVKDMAASNVYVIFAVASTLGANVGQGKTPMEFMEKFMVAWGDMA